jgi:hypothetical protein
MRGAQALDERCARVIEVVRSELIAVSRRVVEDVEALNATAVFDSATNEQVC